MRKLTIGCDFDDTMNLLLYAWVQRLNETYNKNVTIEDIKSWNLDCAFPDLTEQQLWAPLRDPTLWDVVQPRPDAVKYIKQLIDDGHTFYVVTATDYRVIGEKAERCLFKHFPFLNKSNLIVTYNKQLLNLDVMIDDAIHNLEGFNALKILFDMPHNQESFNIEDYRVDAWETIYNIITNFANVVD